MNSKDFFIDEKINSKWKNKSGIYVIECPVLSKEYGKQMAKVGYATHSLYTRVADYRTAYSVIPFKIHCLYHIPEKVKYKRVQYARISENILHKTLEKERVLGTNEWFIDFKKIMSCVNQLRKNHLKYIESSKDWDIYNPYQDKMYNKRIYLFEEEKVFPKGTVTKLEARYQPERGHKRIIGLTGAIDRNNKLEEGVIDKYKIKKKTYMILLNNGEEIEINEENIDKFVKMELKF